MNVLISLLGKVDRTTSSGYPKTAYRFDDGGLAHAAFLGWALQHRLKPDRLLIIGSSTSMWDHLFEGDLDLADEAEDLRVELIALCDQGQPVPPELLARLQPVLSRSLDCDVRLVIARRGLDAESQFGLFESLAEIVEPGDQLSIDCTHGFRHMPMLLLAGAQYLEGLGKASVAAVYYGLMEPGNPEAQVCRLDSLLEIERGVRALEHLDASGDYEPLINLLEPHLPDHISSGRLREAAFHERTLRISNARKTLQDFYRFLDSGHLPFPHALLRTALLERLAWANEPSHHQRQLACSRIALSRRDYPRGTALLFEAAVNEVVHGQQLGDPENSEVRERAREILEDRIRNGEAPRNIRLLRRLRNAIAHGARPVGADAQRLIGSEDELRAFLNELVDELGRGARAG